MHAYIPFGAGSSRLAGGRLGPGRPRALGRRRSLAVALLGLGGAPLVLALTRTGA